MAGPRIQVDTDGFGDAMTAGPMREALRDEAERIAGRARGSAPVDTGAYRDSIHVESDTWKRGAAHYAIERVVASDPVSLLVEAKTSNLKRAIGG